MISLDKFLLALAEKAGIQANDPKLGELLAHTELSKINVSTEIEQPLQQKLLSVDDAKNNHPAIKSHYFAEIMSNVDRSLDAVYAQAGFTPEEIGEFNKERSSTKRITLVGAALKAKSEAGAGTGSTKDDKALQTKIDQLNGELATLKTTLSTKESEYNDKITGIKRDTKFEGKLSGIKTIYDNLPAEVRTMTLAQLINKEIQDNGGQLQLDETGNLQLVKKDGSNFYDENNKLTSVDGFIEKTLAKNKLLPQTQQANDNSGQQQQQQSGGQQQQNNVAGTNGQTKKVNVGSVYSDALKSLEQNANPISIL